MSDVFCRKIYVSSGQRISGTPSDFKFSLVRNVSIPKRCAAFVSDVSIPHTWTNCDTHVNTLYWEEYSQNTRIALQLALMESFINFQINNLPTFIGFAMTGLVGQTLRKSLRRSMVMN